MKMQEEKAILLFDGICNLCNTSVNFVLRRDRKNIFLFASLQSVKGKQLAKKYSLHDQMDSFVLIWKGKAYTRSTAALRVLKMLGFPWSVNYSFIIVPPFIRNGIYNFISRNRYRFFGKRESCMVPTPELRSKFLE